MLSRIFKKNTPRPDFLNNRFNSNPSIHPESIDFAFNVAKRLDEHRETVEDLLVNTNYLATQEEHPWRISHLATQDDYLMYLFYLRHSIWPLDKITPKLAKLGPYRSRPRILGPCAHPLFIRDYGLIESFKFDESPDIFQAYESNVRHLIVQIINTCFCGVAGAIDPDKSGIPLPSDPVDFITQAILLYAKKISDEASEGFSDVSADQHSINKFNQACLFYQNSLSKIEPFYPIELFINEIKNSPIHLSKVYDNFPKIILPYLGH